MEESKFKDGDIVIDHTPGLEVRKCRVIVVHPKREGYNRQYEVWFDDTDCGSSADEADLVLA